MLGKSFWSAAAPSRPKQGIEIPRYSMQSWVPVSLSAKRNLRKNAFADAMLSAEIKEFQADGNRQQMASCSFNAAVDIYLEPSKRIVQRFQAVPVHGTTRLMASNGAPQTSCRGPSAPFIHVLSSDVSLPRNKLPSRLGPRKSRRRP